MKNKHTNVFLLLIVLLAFSACQAAPSATVETEIIEPADPPQKALITEENAGSMQVTLAQSVNFGAITPTWRDDSDAFWLMDIDVVVLRDSENGEVLAQYGPIEYHNFHDVSPDGKLFAYTVEPEEIHLMDITTGSDTVSITTGFPYSTAFFSPDGKTLAVPSMMDLKVVFFDTSSGAETGSVSGFDTAAPAYSAKFSPDGKTLLWFARGTVQPMAIAGEKMGPVLSHQDFVTYQEVSPDGKVIATVATGSIGDDYSPLITLWNAASGDTMAQIPYPTYLRSISFSPDSKLLASATEDGFVIYTSPYGEEVARYETDEETLRVLFSPDGTQLLTISELGFLQIFTVE